VVCFCSAQQAAKADLFVRESPSHCEDAIADNLPIRWTIAKQEPVTKHHAKIESANEIEAFVDKILNAILRARDKGVGARE